jgi:hypothetical protein
MTKLEIILIVVLWIVYGVYAAVRTYNNLFKGDYDDVVAAIGLIVVSPLVLIYRAIYGIFQSY